MAHAPAERRDGLPPFLTLYVTLFLALFATHLDLYLGSTGQLGANTIHLFVAAAAPVLARLAAGPDSDLLIARSLETLHGSILPLGFFFLWLVGHLLFMTRTIFVQAVDFTQYFPLFQLTVLVCGLILASSPRFGRRCAPRRRSRSSSWARPSSGTPSTLAPSRWRTAAAPASPGTRTSPPSTSSSCSPRRCATARPSSATRS
jgi:hypothetical protein